MAPLVCMRASRDATALGCATASILLALTFAGTAAATTIDIPLPFPESFSTTIDNVYAPLPLTSSFAYRAETEDGCEYDKVTVTTETRQINIGGAIYTTLIVHDQEWVDQDCDFVDVALVEDTHDYFAQDSEGRVWYFGEESWAADDETGQCVDDGSWEAGVDGAEPGILMLANPAPGHRYRQEFYEDEAEDWGAVLRLNAKVSIDFGDFAGCLMTREWTPLEPGAVEHKFYCPQSGNPGPGGLVFVEELKGKNVYVEYIGTDFGVVLPGEGDVFPSGALDCEL